ncbi:TrkA C-terminal domain-containing protein [Nitrospira sp. Kam-Ns4a]
MTAEFLHRVRKDLTITLDGVRETVLAIAERVTRKVQILNLQWNAASLGDQIASAHQELGQHLCAVLSEDQVAHRLDGPARAAIEQRLADCARRIRLLKRDLDRTEGVINELEREALREELLALQRDLTVQSALVERLVVPRGSAAIGQSVRDLSLPTGVRLVALFRGPTLLLSFEHLRFRAGDAVVLLGVRDDLKQAVSRFLARQSATA